MHVELHRFLARLAGTVALALSAVALVAFATVPLGRDAHHAQVQDPDAPAKHMT